MIEVKCAYFKHAKILLRNFDEKKLAFGIKPQYCAYIVHLSWAESNGWMQMILSHLIFIKMCQNQTILRHGYLSYGLKLCIMPPRTMYYTLHGSVFS